MTLVMRNYFVPVSHCLLGFAASFYSQPFEV